MSERITGMKADELVSVQQDPTGRATRLVFTKDGQSRYLLFDTNQLRTLMPILAAATNPVGAPNLAINVTALDMHVSEAGEGMLTLVNSAGAEMTFGLTNAQLQRLSILSAEAQQILADLAKR